MNNVNNGDGRCPIKYQYIETKTAEIINRTPRWVKQEEVETPLTSTQIQARDRVIQVYNRAKAEKILNKYLKLNGIHIKLDRVREAILDAMIEYSNEQHKKWSINENYGKHCNDTKPSHEDHTALRALDIYEQVKKKKVTDALEGLFAIFESHKQIYKNIIMENELKLGDVVVLKSHPTQKMTITELEDKKTLCSWFNSFGPPATGGEFRHDEFPIEALELVKSTGESKEVI